MRSRGLGELYKIQVQDYKAFPDMFTFFKEVAGELKVRLRKENYSAYLYNAPNQRYFEKSPLYIIDGLLTPDNNYVYTTLPPHVRFRPSVSSTYFTLPPLFLTSVSVASHM